VNQDSIPLQDEDPHSKNAGIPTQKEHDHRHPKTIADQRHYVLGTVLLVIFLPISILSTVAVYQFMGFANLEPPAKGLDPQTEFIESTQNALWHGPREQRFEIINHLGSRGNEAKPFLEDLREIAAGKDADLAEAASIAIERIEGSEL
jgi:hypothetical protein